MAYPTKPKQYAIDVRAFDTPEAQLVFTIDYTRLDEKMVKQVIGFHSGDDDLLRECYGDLERALVLKTVQWAHREMIAEDINAFGVSCYFDEAEGWPGDGMIKFDKATYDSPEIAWDDLTVTATEQDAPAG